VFVTGIRNKAYEERVGTYKRVQGKRKKKLKKKPSEMHFVKNWLLYGWGYCK